MELLPCLSSFEFFFFSVIAGVAPISHGAVAFLVFLGILLSSYSMQTLQLFHFLKKNNVLLISCHILVVVRDGHRKHDVTSTLSQIARKEHER